MRKMKSMLLTVRELKLENSVIRMTNRYNAQKMNLFVGSGKNKYFMIICFCLVLSFSF